MHNFTRQQLYEAVWSRPLNSIVKEYGTPYEELVRACELMTVVSGAPT